MKAWGMKGLGWTAAVLLAGTAAMAQMPGDGLGVGPGFGEHRPPMERAFGPDGDHGRWWNNPKIAERLKLTEEQRKAFDGILLAHREKLIDLRASLEKAELTLEPLMGDDQPNEARILAQIDKVAQARAELEKANARFLLAIRAKLTPEQWKQLQADRASHGPERHGLGPEGRGRDGQFHPPALPPVPQGAAPQGDEPQGAGPQGTAAPETPGAGDQQ